MQSKLTKAAGDKAQITAELEVNQIVSAKEKAISKLGEGVEAKGFRKGKAPLHVIEASLDQAQLQQEAIQQAAAAAYPKLIEKHGLNPLSAPHVEVKKFVPYSTLELVFTVTAMPDFKLFDYKKITKQKSKANVTESEVVSVLESLRQRAAKRKAVNRASKRDDEIVINMQGKQKGKAVPGTSAKDYTVIIGSNRLVPGFEENLIGLKAGDKKSFSVKFPKDYPENWLAGTDVDFEVGVKNVNELLLPKLDNKFAAEIAPKSTVADLKKDIKKQLEIEKEQTNRRKITDEIVGEVVEKTDLNPPSEMVEHQYRHLWADFENNVKSKGQTVDEYLQSVKQTKSEVETMLKKDAARRVKTALILSEIAKAEKLSVTPEEIEIRLQILAGQYKDEQMQKQLQSPQARQEVKDQLLIEKTVNKLVEITTGG